MTLEEKQEAIINYCRGRACSNCPLFHLKETCADDLTVIDRNYEIIFGSEEENDSVNRPSHYTDGNIEVIDYIEDKKLGFCLGNAIKYISRAGKKDPSKEVEDLNKAIWYINRRIKEIQEGLV